MNKPQLEITKTPKFAGQETMTRDVNGLRNIGDQPESYRKHFVFIALFVLNSLSLGVPV